MKRIISFVFMLLFLFSEMNAQNSIKGIVIDNDSTDTTQEKLEKLAGIDKKLKVIFNLNVF